ncbi:MAG: hypothetical protein H6R17_3627 [Proteobacteria bacterium]|nr:hypothetical protein [Pseudomonadota bacterium]
MKPLLVLVVLLLQCSASPAQGVYVTPGANGPVFSDKPQPGAREVSLPPLNVVAPPQPPSTPVATPGKDERAKPDTEAVAYRSFAIVVPENESGVTANDAVFAVRVVADPPLQLGEGHAFAVSINGRAVGRRFTTTEFMIPREFWGDEVPPHNFSVQLDASIVDARGQALKQAAAVRFVMLHSFQ